jgi:two-component system repressor protein LuxO
VIIITAQGSVQAAVAAMQDGAADFLEKPFSAQRLLVTLTNALEKAALENALIDFEDTARPEFQAFIGASLVMQAVYRVTKSAATSNAPVFISGESGTGKELAARAVHDCSDRSTGPFVTINCAALPRDLMESEMFSRKGGILRRGSQSPGCRGTADGGTLFLDEIAEMDLALQAKMLGFLQSDSYRPVGANNDHCADIRLVTATNRNIKAKVAARRFHEDLYYRLVVIPLELPPWRARRKDVLQIARLFLSIYSEEGGRKSEAMQPAVEALLLAHHWQGNVRELQNIIRRLVILEPSERISDNAMQAALAMSTSVMNPDTGEPFQELARQTTISNQSGGGPSTRLRQHPSTTRSQPLRQIKKDAILAAIAACDGNIPKAAARLKVSPSSIYRKQLAWQIEQTDDCF